MCVDGLYAFHHPCVCLYLCPGSSVGQVQLVESCASERGRPGSVRPAAKVCSRACNRVGHVLQCDYNLSVRNGKVEVLDRVTVDHVDYLRNCDVRQKILFRNGCNDQVSSALPFRKGKL